MKVIEATEGAGYGEIVFGEERIFIREAHRPKPNHIEYAWSEVVRKK